MADKPPKLPATRSAFLDKVRQSKAVASATPRETLAKALAPSGRPRLLFAMDATASREPSWQLAQTITGAMFAAVPGALDVALAYHGGGRLKEVTPFAADTRAFLDKVHTVQCEAGGTALTALLEAATTIARLKALIYVGDCFEEDPAVAGALAQQLRLKGVRVFVFHDTTSQQQGYDVDGARAVFAQLAAVTSGVLLPFDADALDQVKALLEAIAVYAVGGLKLLAARQRALPAARLLLDQLRP
jgi:hypothetical protein